MTKTAVRRLVVENGDQPDVPSLSDQMTPECFLCGEEHVGISTNAMLMLRGQWLPSTEHDIPVFLLDADTKLRILQMPNGQLALVSDQLGHPTKHAHMECLEFLADEALNEETEDDEDDEEEYA